MMRGMRWFLAAAAVLVACGGSTSASVFDEPFDSSTAATDGAATDGAATDRDTSAPGADVAPRPDSEPPPKMDAPAPGCPGGMTKKPEMCPSICNGGCVEDACRIVCNFPSSCGGRRVDCPPGMKCVVECSGASSCGGLELRCAETGACALNCTGPSSCGNVQMRCPTSASCALTCGGFSSCHGTQIACGPGACSATCTGGGSAIGKLNCGPSCICVNKC